MSYRFHEVRKGECQRVIAFAAEHGCTVKPEALRHHLSLVVESDEETLAAALCVEHEPDRFVIEIVVGEGAPDQTLLTELADRCLRKVQAEAIASARLHSTNDGPTNTIWSRTNWLDRVEETPPPGLDAPAEEDAAVEIDASANDPAQAA